MSDLYQLQKNRQGADFRRHQYDCFSVATVGDVVDMPYGERATLVYKATGMITPEGEYTDEELEELCQDTITYVFKDDDDIYNTYVYIGGYYVYDFPDIHEYHQGGMLEIDPNDYNIGGHYETTYEYNKGE